MKAGAFLRASALVLLVFAAVWFAVVLYWQVSNASPTALDLALYLLVLPLVLLCGFWLLRGVIRRRRASRAAVPAGADDDSAQSSIDSGPQPDRIVHLLASAAWLRAGGSGLAIAEAMAKPDRPTLHPQLRDSLGLPVLAAAVEDLDPVSIGASLRTVMTGPDVFDRVFGEEYLRAIALLDPVAEELLSAALPPVPVEAPELPGGPGLHPHAMHHSRSSRAAAPDAAPPMLRVRLLLPATWSAAARQASGDWLLAKARAVGFHDHQLSSEVLAVNSAGEVWRLLDQLGHTQARDGDDDRHLVLAAHSLIGTASIDRLDAGLELLVSGHPEGLIPGEGAAGLLLGSATARFDPDAPTPVRLHRLLHGRAGTGRGASRQAAELLRHAIDTAAQPDDALALVFSDADHRPSRAIEVAGAISTTLPELEPVDDARHLGLVCGDTGAVAPLALLAAAAAQSAQDEAPVLVFSLADPLVRIALVISPLPAENPGSNTDSAEAATADSATA